MSEFYCHFYSSVLNSPRYKDFYDPLVPPFGRNVCQMQFTFKGLLEEIIKQGRKA